ncbi:hypothetical protein MNBD_BACTEROID07-1110, partial [hydrothermal vent metagenome]
KEYEKNEFVEKLISIEKSYGLCAALLLLYKQQVKSGFVLADPTDTTNKEFYDIRDEKTGVIFHVQWNPDRELRKNHKLLIDRGVIASVPNTAELINKDDQGKACYLCSENIRIQNPAEIIYPLRLSGEEYFLGANFAYLANNHFTLFNKEHRPQLYRKEILFFLFDFLDKTNGCFRGIFNGLAGASIEHHEHMQVTTEKFPVEDINIPPEVVILNNDKIRISLPHYYTSLLLLESPISGVIVKYADTFLTKWHKLNPEYHTENIVAVKHHNHYRLFIFPRDKRKLAGKGKTGAMASFEVSGNIVLSDNSIERSTFDNISLTSVQNMLAGIKPTTRIEQLFP